MLEPRPPDLLGKISWTRDGHDVLVVRAVEDADLAPSGQAAWTRQRKSCASSISVGRLNEMTRQPSGLTPLKTLRIVPSLPEASTPWRTSRTLRRCSAHSRVWSFDSSSCRSRSSSFASTFPVQAQRVGGVAPGERCRRAGLDDQALEHRRTLSGAGAWPTRSRWARTEESCARAAQATGEERRRLSVCARRRSRSRPGRRPARSRPPSRRACSSRRAGRRRCRRSASSPRPPRWRRPRCRARPRSPCRRRDGERGRLRAVGSRAGGAGTVVVAAAGHRPGGAAERQSRDDDGCAAILIRRGVIRFLLCSNRRRRLAGADESAMRAASHRPVHRRGDNATVRVLIVEDEPKLAGLLRRGLVEEAHAADVAASGEDALWMAQRDRVRRDRARPDAARAWTASRSAGGCARTASGRRC